MRDPAVTAKRWNVLPPMPPDVQARLRGYHPVLLQILYNRKQDTVEKVQRYLEGGGDTLHDPFTMSDMGKAVERIRHAIAHGEMIAVYGDFDADGVTSTALLTQAIEALDGRVIPYIPDRVDEGYGLNREALQRLKDDGIKLVITVDCGIRAVEEVAFGNSLGLDLIVTDHHSLGDELPPALAVLDPKIDAFRRQENGGTDGYPEDMLAGVGVAYKLADALFREEERQTGRRPAFKLEDLLDLVALGTVADLAPLDRLENRELVRRGLEVMNRGQRAGLFELMQVARVEPGKVNTTSIGYMLGPRINAAGRLESAMIAYHLLRAPMPEASEYARQLQDINLRRQTLMQEAVEAARVRALDGADDLPLLFDAGTDFRPGIVGLVAGRLCEDYYRPAIVIHQGPEESRGSCRSIPEFDITKALDQCADLLVRHGGHAQAAGFTVRNSNLGALRERLMAMAQEALRERDLRPTLEIDAEVPFELLTMDLAQALKALEPTGARNGTPSFVTRGLSVKEVRQVGQEGKHLKLRLARGEHVIDAIGFKLGHLAFEPWLAREVDVACHLEQNEWNNHTKLQINIHDIRAAE